MAKESIQVTAVETLRVLALEAAHDLDENVPYRSSNTQVVMAATKASTVLRLIAGLIAEVDV